MKNQLLIALWNFTENRSYLKPTGLIDRLSKTTGLSIVDVKTSLGQLAKDGKIKGVTRRGDITGNVQVLAIPPKPALSELQQKWRDELNRQGYTYTDIDRLTLLADYLDGMTGTDMKKLLDGIDHIKNNMSKLIDQDPYVVSARYLLSSSKALRVMADSFGISFSEFKGRNAYIVVAGPAEPEAILFIENKAPFENFCASDASEKIMGVATFGYDLSWSGVAKDLRSEKVIHLIRKGSPPHLREVIDSKPSYFWGDLDREGLMIYMQLQQAIPELKLSALYRPMIDALKQGRGHPYGRLSGKDGQRMVVSNHELINGLARLCANGAVDQEVVDVDQIADRAGKPLQWDNW